MSEFGKALVESAEQALAIARGEAEPAREHRIAAVDVKAIRKKQRLTQDAFARTYALSTAAVRDWEQGRRRPDTISTILLKTIEQAPEIVQAVAREVVSGDPELAEAGARLDAGKPAGKRKPAAMRAA